MSEWKAKRFWDTATPVARDGGYAVDLDGRAVKTPAKAALILPTLVMAEAVAAEWDAQEKDIDPHTMPVTRGANAAIDKVAMMRAAVIDELAGYGGTDLLCYRATGPEQLLQNQADGWDPWLAWAADTLDAPLVTGAGVMHIPQKDGSLKALHDAVSMFDNFGLAGLHDLVALSGSLILALAVTQRKILPNDAWNLSRIDEDWQISQWGDDEEASIAAGVKRRAFLDAAVFVDLARGVASSCDDK